MAADYSKACDHELTETTSNGTYCIGCGTRMITEPGPVKLDYATAVNDSRVLNWRRIPHAGALPMPLDKPFYTAWRIVPWGSPVGEVHWRVERVEPGKPCPALAQWWADDLLGLPPCND